MVYPQFLLQAAKFLFKLLKYVYFLTITPIRCFTKAYLIGEDALDEVSPSTSVNDFVDEF